MASRVGNTLDPPPVPQTTIGRVVDNNRVIDVTGRIPINDHLDIHFRLLGKLCLGIRLLVDMVHRVTNLREFVGHVGSRVLYKSNVKARIALTTPFYFCSIRRLGRPPPLRLPHPEAIRS